MLQGNNDKMANYISLLMLIVIFAFHVSSADREPNNELSTSVQTRPSTSIARNYELDFCPLEPVERDVCDVNDNKKVKKPKKKYRAKRIKRFVFENVDSKPMYQRIIIGMLQQLEHSLDRLYKKFYDYPQYMVDKASDSSPELLDNVILGVIVYINLYIIKFMVDVYFKLEDLYYKYKHRSFNV